MIIMIQNSYIIIKFELIFYFIIKLTNLNIKNKTIKMEYKIILIFLTFIQLSVSYSFENPFFKNLGNN